MPLVDHDARAHAFAVKLGAHLKTLRLARRLTQPQVAELLGGEAAVETISRFERGANTPSPIWVSRFAEVYGTSLEDVYLGAIGRRLVDDPKRQALHDLVDQADGVNVEVALMIADATRKAVAETLPR